MTVSEFSRLSPDDLSRLAMAFQIVPDHEGGDPYVMMAKAQKLP